MEGRPSFRFLSPITSAVAVQPCMPSERARADEDEMPLNEEKSETQYLLESSALQREHLFNNGNHSYEKGKRWDVVSYSSKVWRRAENNRQTFGTHTHTHTHTHTTSTCCFSPSAASCAGLVKNLRNGLSGVRFQCWHSLVMVSKVVEYPRLCYALHIIHTLISTLTLENVENGKKIQPLWYLECNARQRLHFALGRRRRRRELRAK